MESEDIVDGGGESPKTERRMSRRFEMVSLLENNRMRNVGLWLCLFSFFSLPAALRAAQTCRYLIYSEADFEVFRPTGATRCTDGG